MPSPPRLAFAVAAVFIADLPRLPAQPALATPAHLGATRGRRVDLVLAGTKLTGVTGVRTSFPAKVTVPPGQTDPAKLAVTLDIPADAPIGPHTIRVVAKAGESAPRPFAVDELPEVTKGAANHTKATAQPVPVPCVVVGAADPDAGDFYRVPVKAGRPVTLEVVGRRLGSEIDPVLIVSDGAGRELAGVYADDTPGLKTDARVVYQPKADGEIVVEVRDTTYRGGAGFGYRLRVGDFPGVTTAFPLAVQRGEPTAVGFAGPGADTIPPVTLTAPADPAVTTVFATPRRPGGSAGWPVPVLVSDHPEGVEQEPNDGPGTATRLPVPGGVSARFAAKGDKDFFAFAGKKGRKVVVRALTTEVNAPTEIRLRVLGPDGAEVAKSDPAKPGALVEFAPPADGDYRIACDPLNHLAGPNEVYHLSVTAAKKTEKK